MKTTNSNKANESTVKLTDLAQLTVNPDVMQTKVFIVDSVVNTYTPSSVNSDKEKIVGTPILTIDVAENIRLIFEGGQIDVPTSCAKLILKGKNTYIEPSPYQIFGNNVEIEGTWDVKRVYPQWFDQRAGKDKRSEMNFHDVSPAINKAAEMARVGEVFLLEGDYFIANPIKLPVSVRLIGEGPLSAILPYLSDEENRKWPGKALVEININENAGENVPDWEASYPRPFGMMSDLFFFNKRAREDHKNS